ncbi:ribonuclease HI family protein [Enterococcus cecorum]|uniref:ribonuclease HI family protein n=1 Tax=Enterococcus cecorum TaxID=44008 RepID=UPI003266D8C4
MLKVYVDAASKPQTPYGGIGIVLSEKEFYQQIAIPIQGDFDNHELEFQAVLYALEECCKHHFQDKFINIYSDSKIVVQTLEKNYTRNEKFSKYLTLINEKLTTFQFVFFHWISDRQNKGADNLARQGLQKALKNR